METTDQPTRVCAACGRQKAHAEFPADGAVCRICRNKQGVRARSRALRRLALERPQQYRAACERRLQASLGKLPPPQARKRAVVQGASDLARQYPERYQQLRQEELRQAQLEPHPGRLGRPPGAPDRLAIGSPSFARTWQPPARRRRAPAGRATAAARARADRERVRRRAAALFAKGQSATAVARKLGVARQTAVSWRARWRTGGAAALQSRRTGRWPSIPDSQLPLIDQALRQGPAAHGFATRAWTSTQVGIVVQRVTGVQLGPTAVKRLLRERLGWTVQRP